MRDSLILRAARGPDEATLLAPIANAANTADGLDEFVSVAELANWLSRPGPHFDPAVDLVIGELDDATVAYGWVSWVDTSDALREYRLGGYVHPGWRGRGIGRTLLHWQEERARSHAAAHPTERPIMYGSWAPEERLAKIALLEAEGYTPARYFFEMIRPDLGEVRVPPLPEGLEVRPLPSGREAWRRLFAADTEAFRDHWGGFTADDAAFEEWVNDPNFDPSLFVVAHDGEEIAGAVINRVPAEENEAFGRRYGWLDSVFVRRPWRRRGLAAALVARSLVLLGERGLTTALLGVDSDNPNGALGLYRAAGFEVHRRSRAYRKPMELDR